MKRNRKKASISSNRWANYAIAGAATAAASLAGQAAVDADITVVNVGTQISGPSQLSYFGPYSLGGTQASFGFVQSNSRNFMYVQGTGVTFAGFTATFNSAQYTYASNLAYGQQVSQVPAFSAAQRGLMAWGTGYPYSQFVQPGRAFVGFRFDVGNGTQYGYAEVIMDGVGGGNTGTFVKYAWADPGESIFAGQVPEPGALGVLAMGSVGLLAWRRRRTG